MGRTKKQWDKYRRDKRKVNIVIQSSYSIKHSINYSTRPILVPFKYVKEIMSYGIKLSHEYGGITFCWDYEDIIYAFKELNINIIYPNRDKFKNSDNYYLECNKIIEEALNKIKT